MINNPIKKENDDLEWRNKNGQLHRENGPAFISSNNYKVWYLNGREHRLDGPCHLFFVRYRILGSGLIKIEFNNWILRIRAVYKINYTLNRFYDRSEKVLYSL